jgi:hypothetical protein
VAVSLFALGVPACSGTNPAPASVPPETPSFIDACIDATPPPTPASTPGLKPQSRAFVKTPIRGLIDLGQINFEIMPPAPYNTLYYACLSQTEISGIVVNDTWADLQPDYAGQPLNTATIDAALQLVERYNRFPGRWLGVRLRVWAGFYAPEWAKAIGGPAVDICDQGAVPQPVPTSTTPTPCPGAAIKTVGRFWSDAYDAAWRALQSQLALKYDNDPFVTEVSLSSCSSLTSEPFVQPEDNYSRANMQASGYTDAGYQMCLAGAVARDYAPYWHVTPVDFHSIRFSSSIRLRSRATSPSPKPRSTRAGRSSAAGASCSMKRWESSRRRHRRRPEQLRPAPRNISHCGNTCTTPAARLPLRQRRRPTF